MGCHRLPNIFALQPNDMIPCKDGWAVIATPYGEHWNRFVEVMGDPDWASLEVFANGRLRGANWDALRPLIEEWAMRHTGEEIMHMAQGRSIPCFPAFTVGQMVDSDQIKSRDYFWTAPVNGEPLKVPGRPSSSPKHPIHCARSRLSWASTITTSVAYLRGRLHRT
jgi:crotonobetainyl-CoA:carnitine CoA-transferase CaiB-like acyl-CoA transferase